MMMNFWTTMTRSCEDSKRERVCLERYFMEADIRCRQKREDGGVVFVFLFMGEVIGSIPFANSL